MILRVALIIIFAAHAQESKAPCAQQGEQWEFKKTREPLLLNDRVHIQTSVLNEGTADQKILIQDTLRIQPKKGEEHGFVQTHVYSYDSSKPEDLKKFGPGYMGFSGNAIAYRQNEKDLFWVMESGLTLKLMSPTGDLIANIDSPGRILSTNFVKNADGKDLLRIIAEHDDKITPYDIFLDQDSSMRLYKQEQKPQSFQINTEADLQSKAKPHQKFGIKVKKVTSELKGQSLADAFHYSKDNEKGWSVFTTRGKNKNHITVLKPDGGVYSENEIPHDFSGKAKLMGDNKNPVLVVPRYEKSISYSGINKSVGEHLVFFKLRNQSPSTEVKIYMNIVGEPQVLDPNRIVVFYRPSVSGAVQIKVFNESGVEIKNDPLNTIKLPQSSGDNGYTIETMGPDSDERIFFIRDGEDRIVDFYKYFKKEGISTSISQSNPEIKKLIETKVQRRITSSYDREPNQEISTTRQLMKSVRGDRLFLSQDHLVSLNWNGKVQFKLQANKVCPKGTLGDTNQLKQVKEFANGYVISCTGGAVVLDHAGKELSRLAYPTERDTNEPVEVETFWDGSVLVLPRKKDDGFMPRHMVYFYKIQKSNVCAQPAPKATGSSHKEDTQALPAKE